MTLYQYKGVDARGEVVRGQLEAVTQERALRQMQSTGLLVTSIKPIRKGSSAKRPRRTSFRLLHARFDLLRVTRDLAILLKASLSLPQALLTMSEVAENEADRDFVSVVAKRLGTGQRFSDALRGNGRALPPYYLGIIEAAERSGRLATAMEELAETLERQSQLRSSIRSALIYPTLVVLVAIACLYVLIAFVLPQFRDLFEAQGAPIPESMSILLGIGAFAEQYYFLILSVGLGSIWLFWRARQRPVSRRTLERAAMAMPLLGDLHRKVVTARFARSLSTLLLSGADLAGSVPLAAKATSSEIAQAEGERLTAALRRGEAFAATLSQSTLFPPLLRRFAEVGERGGQLPKLLLKAAELYEDDVQRSLKRMVALLVPCITVILGLLVGTLAASLLTAMLDAYELAV